MSKDFKKYGRIGVLLGGVSTEREISFKSGKAVVEALAVDGCDVVAIEINSDKKSEVAGQIRKAGIDIAFIALHGYFGEDGKVQEILDELRIPYPGSGVASSRIAIDKIQTQSLLKKHHISVADYVVLRKNNPRLINDAENLLKSGPVVVKPSCGGSSIGVTIVESAADLPKALDEAWQQGDEILVERFIKGREMTVGIIDGKALAVIEVSPSGGAFFDFTAKYKSADTEYKIPAEISGAQSKEIQAAALKAFKLLNCEDFGRVDLILAPDGKAYILEVNTIPGFTATSLLPKAAKLAGLSFNQLCLKLVDLAYGKKKTKLNLSPSR